MANSERVISPRQLQRLSPLLLGIWLVAIVLATFQPCAVAAETLAKAVGPGAMSGVQADDRCQRAETACEKTDCCDDKFYSSCSLPDVFKHDDVLNMPVLVQPAAARSTAFLVSLRQVGELENGVMAHLSPADPASIQLAVTRLLI